MKNNIFWDSTSCSLLKVDWCLGEKCYLLLQRRLISSSLKMEAACFSETWKQLRWVIRLLTWHCQLKGHLFKMGLKNSLICERCLERWIGHTNPTDREAVAYLTFRHMGHYFMEPGEYQDAPVSSVELLRGWNRGGCTINHWRSRCKGRFRPTPYSLSDWFIHSFSETSVTFCQTTRRHILDEG
jgi:hypothetical protein